MAERLTLHLDAAEPPARRIPVRYWPNPSTSILGHLTMGEPTHDGELVRYEATFTAGPLHGEAPVYDLRTTVAEDEKEIGRG